MNNIILQKIKEIEQTHQVTILYACESGSRAWGFASPDSDYDVRFIYTHTKDFYLSIDEQRDVIELPINELLDINGWELRKALRLFRKSNAPIYEWLQSPIVYQVNDDFLTSMRSLFAECFSSRAMMHHYISMAKTVFENELSGSEVRLKKYFYALRPILACRWIADTGTVPPMEFSKLRIFMDSSFTSVTNELLNTKAQVDERYTIKPIDALNRFIADQIRYCEQAVPQRIQTGESSDSLNTIFRKFLQ
ncbi:DNA polymerase beta superfamily protein [Ohtaekwangia kribbensis]|jgi:predicted nucleotidyltransferase|uniref:DNA polymerase beta superfamily protein n=1 Tax=Ohtaekwangia kribbensis TaxID=688913 RepID=A0ABW3JYF6_9BACT